MSILSIINKNKKYNFWQNEQLNLAKEQNIDMSLFNDVNINPLHMKEYRIALLNEVPAKRLVDVYKYMKESVKIINTGNSAERNQRILEVFEILVPNKEEAESKYNNFIKNATKSKMLELVQREDIIRKLSEGILNSISYEEIKDKFLPNNIKINKNNNYKPNCAIKGTIIGDCVGSPYEQVYKNDDIGIFNNRKSHITDDSALSIATKNAILDNSKNPDFRNEYIKMYKKHKQLGYGCGFIRWCEGIDLSNDKPYNSCGNGSAMRVSFIGEYYNNVEDVIKNAYNSSVVTHNNYNGIKGAIVTAVCVWMAKNGYSKEEIKNYVEMHYLYKNIDVNEFYHPVYILDENKKMVSNNSIFCGVAVPYAMECFYTTNSLEECFLKILEIVNDGDTICAIAGGVAGAYYGLSLEQETFFYEKIKDLKDERI